MYGERLPPHNYRKITSQASSRAKTALVAENRARYRSLYQSLVYRGFGSRAASSRARTDMAQANPERYRELYVAIKRQLVLESTTETEEAA